MNTAEPSKKAGNGKLKIIGTKADPSVSLDHRQILAALRAFKRGDFEVRMREDLVGVDGQIAETFNELVEMVESIRAEASDVSTAVGKDGRDWGKVIAFHDFGAGSVMEVSGGAMLPFTDAVVPEIDVPGGTVVIDPPAGLLAGGAAKEEES
jgi:hypothetical protein